ncbi:MAG: hypothetical protein AAFU55_17065 [Pseudomonadota bacterium]
MSASLDGALAIFALAAVVHIAELVASAVFKAAHWSRRMVFGLALIVLFSALLGVVVAVFGGVPEPTVIDVLIALGLWFAAWPFLKPRAQRWLERLRPHGKRS